MITFIFIFYKISILLIMSLYEQFYSETNKEYMYSFIGKIVQQELDYDILSEDNNYTMFLEQMKEVFDGNDTDEITVLNKILLDKQVDTYKQKRTTETVVVDNNIGRPSSLEDIMKLRDQQIKPIEEENVEPRNVFLNDTTIVGTSISDLEGTPIEEDPIEEDPIEEKEEEKPKQYNINSSKRTNINSSRFNYSINLKKENIDSSQIKTLSKVIIPIEDNYIFSIPLLSFKIPELNCDLILQQEDLIKNKRGSFGIYKAIEDHHFESRNVDRLSIDIRDITETKYESYDILKVNIVEIKNNIILFTCSNIENNYKENDCIQIINNRSYHLTPLLSQPFKIKKVVQNIIFCKLSGDHENKEYTNIDMRIMNMSNQNVIFFN